jgi:glutamyl-tRNA synthetase
VLLRSDGVPLYNFGCVVDDLTMGITMVARGRDHMVNTPPQLLLYEALGATAPRFAHLPMMLAPSGEKLSKRHGAVSVGEYRSMGYTPMGVLNYLVRFGWSHGDQEIFSRAQLIDAFGWESCGKSDGKFDPKKYADVAFEHLKRDDLTPLAEYAAAVRPFLADLGVTSPDDATLLAAIPAVRERSRTLKDAGDSLVYFFRDPVFDEKARAKFLVPEQADKLDATLAVVGDASAWAAEGVPALAALLEQKLVEGLAARGLALKDVGQPVRVALSGRGVSPPLHETMALLGRDRTIARLERGLALARGT